MKWITALDLARWADMTGARTALSELLSALVRASAVDIQSFRFPTGDSAQIPGYDGRLTAVGVPPYVPDGDSVWEFGVNDDYIQKANEDFGRRTQNPGDVVRSETTFVFVTPRTWRTQSPSREQWCEARQSESDWKAVHVVDGVGLEEWLSQHEGVAARIAREILGNVPRTGVRSIQEFWEEYCSRFKPSLTIEVLLCDRGDHAQRLRNDLLGSPQDIIVRADSPDEAVAFLAAVILSADVDTRKVLESRAVVIDTDEAARQVNQKAKIFVVRGTAAPLGGWLARSSVVVVPIGRDTPRHTGGVMVLSRPTTHALRDALKTMGLSDEEAYQLARTCGRSVTVLARRIPRGDAGKPQWADGQRTLIPALLAGGWHADSPDDQAIVAILAGGVAYDDYEAQLRPLERLQDPPIDREGSVWKVRAPVDAFVHLAYLIGRGDLDRLRAAAIQVFSEEDPSLDLPEEERPLAAINKKQLRHSEWLRDGLATTLLLIAVLHEEAELPMAGALMPQAFVDEVIEALPGLSRDHRLIASLQNELPLLMEAAPRPLLAALEQTLEGDGAKIRPIFREGGGLLGGSSPHTGLLWALEVVAWDPAHLSRVALILVRLARTDPGGRLHNRPLNTLREIFLPWHPGTNATLAKRTAVLDEIIRAEPTVAWSLLVALLPEYHDTAHPTTAPRYREAGASDREVLTWDRVFEGYRGIVGRALRLVSDDVERWKTIIQEVHRFELPLRERTYELLEEFVGRGAGGRQPILWELLQKEVNRHRAFATAEWALKEPELSRLDAMVVALQPRDIVERVAWLFDEDYPFVPPRENTRRRDAVEIVREEAVGEVVTNGGRGALVKLAQRVAYPHHVAISAKVRLESEGEYEELIRSSLGKSDRLTSFALALSGEAERRFGVAWRGRVQALGAGGQWTPAEVATLLFGWQDAPSTWEVADVLGAEVRDSYWRRKRSWPFRQLPAEALKIAVARYLAVGRATAALEAIHDRVGELSVDQIFTVLDAIPAELGAAGSQPSSMFVHELEETLGQLGALEHVPRIELAKREYALFPLLGYRERSLTLHKVLAESAELFVSVLSDVFRPKSGEIREPSEEERAKAQIGYRILSSFRILPGRRENDIDAAALREWVLGVRRLAAEANRAAIADEYIGHLIAHAPSDPEDLAWPHRIVRDLIEEVRSDSVELGVQVERHNRRGTFSKAMFEGGGQERALADEARRWARAAAGWPRTEAMLLSIALSWDSMAAREDERARHNALRYQ